MSDVTFHMRNTKIQISKKALALLESLAELEDAGLISSGDTALARNGYDEGSVEIDTPATVTSFGREILALSKNSTD